MPCVVACTAATADAWQLPTSEPGVFLIVWLSLSFPVVGLTIRGVEIRDTALTYYGKDEASKHGMPTGG